MWPLWTSTTRVAGDDGLLLHYPLHVLWKNSLAKGEFPFWNPYTFAGMPAFADIQAGYAYPLHWLLLPLSAIAGLNWSITLHVVLAAFGAAYCARRLGATPAGQFLSGIAYALGSVTIPRLWLGHMHLIEAEAWLPLAMGLATDVSDWRRAFFLTLPLAMILLLGRPDVFAFAGWALVMWAAFAAIPRGSRAVVWTIARVTVSLVLAAGIAAVQLVPSFEMLAASNRTAGLSWEARTLASLPPWHALTLLTPSLFGDPTGTYWAGPFRDWSERLLYVGVLPLAAAFAVADRWRWLCAGLAGIAVALSLGRYLPGYGAVAMMPLYGYFRVPPRHLVLAVLGLAMAAGLGLERLNGRRVAAVALGSAIAIFVAVQLATAGWIPALVGMVVRTTGAVPPQAGATQAAAGLRLTAFLLAALGASALLPRPWSTRAQLLIALVDLGFVLAPYRRHLIDPAPRIDQANQLRRHTSAAVVGNDGPLYASLGPILGVVQPSGYNPSVSREYAALLMGEYAPDAVAIAINRADDPALPLLGIEAAYENGHAVWVRQPSIQAWVAGCAWPGGALTVRQADFPRSACVAWSGAQTRDAPVPPRPAKILKQATGALSVQAEGPGHLVTNQPWYPGWSARLNGKPAAIQIVDGALVGLELPSGVHVADLVYRPAGLVLGAVLSIASCAALAAMWWLSQKRVPTTGAPTENH